MRGLVRLAGFLAWPAFLSAQAPRHPEPGFYLEAGAGVSYVEFDRRYSFRPTLGWGAGVGWIAPAGFAMSANLERVADRNDAAFDVTLTYVALQPTYFFDRHPYTALYVGGRLVAGWKHAGYTVDFRDPTRARGLGVGLVAGARSQASPVLGFDGRIAAVVVWFGDLAADGLRIADTGSRATHLQFRLALTISP